VGPLVIPNKLYAVRRSNVNRRAFMPVKRMLGMVQGLSNALFCPSRLRIRNTGGIVRMTVNDLYLSLRQAFIPILEKTMFTSLTQLLASLLWFVIVIYIIGVIIFILLDNRSPQSTFAWLFLMLTFPFLGFLIYVLFGRNYKAFSNETKLARLGKLSSPYVQVIKPLRDVQNDYIEIIRREKTESYRHNLLALVTRNSPSLLTV
jgi:hypothetical protein